MKIYLETSSGSYPSRKPMIIVDTANLKEEERNQLQKMIEDSNFFDITDSLPVYTTNTTSHSDLNFNNYTSFVKA